MREKIISRKQENKTWEPDDEIVNIIKNADDVGGAFLEYFLVVEQNFPEYDFKDDIILKLALEPIYEGAMELQEKIRNL